MHFPELKLRELSAIRVAYRGDVGAVPRILIVQFSGQYGTGSEGNDDAAFMSGALAAGVATWRPQGVVLDLRELQYEWGDGLFTRVIALARSRDCGLLAEPELVYPVTVVVGPASRPGFEGALSRSGEPWVFDTLETAVARASRFVEQGASRTTPVS